MDDIVFNDRTEAAERLATRPELQVYKDDPNAIVIGLPRGGVPMAKIIATALNLPMDIVVPRKIGHPQHPEYALGALTEFGDIYWNRDFLHRQAFWDSLTPESPEVLQVIAEERAESQRRKQLYRGQLPDMHLANKTAIIVDDGVATGATIRASVISLQKLHVHKVIVAVPVGSPDTIRDLRHFADDVICVLCPHNFHAVGQFYEHFDQISDAEVLEIMRDVVARSASQANDSLPMHLTVKSGPLVERTKEALAADVDKEKPEYTGGRTV